MGDALRCGERTSSGGHGGTLSERCRFRSVRQCVLSSSSSSSPRLAPSNTFHRFPPSSNSYLRSVIPSPVSFFSLFSLSLCLIYTFFFSSSGFPLSLPYPSPRCLLLDVSGDVCRCRCGVLWKSIHCEGSEPSLLRSEVSFSSHPSIPTFKTQEVSPLATMDDAPPYTRFSLLCLFLLPSLSPLAAMARRSSSSSTRRISNPRTRPKRRTEFFFPHHRLIILLLFLRSNNFTLVFLCTCVYVCVCVFRPSHVFSLDFV